MNPIPPSSPLDWSPSDEEMAALRQQEDTLRTLPRWVSLSSLVPKPHPEYILDRVIRAFANRHQVTIPEAQRLITGPDSELRNIIRSQQELEACIRRAGPLWRSAKRLRQIPRPPA